MMEKYWSRDPRAVNIDEFVETWIPLSVASSGENTWFLALLGFVLFRLIDIFKPLECRTMERFSGGMVLCSTMF